MESRLFLNRENQCQLLELGWMSGASLDGRVISGDAVRTRRNTATWLPVRSIMYSQHKLDKVITVLAHIKIYILLPENKFRYLKSLLQ